MDLYRNTKIIRESCASKMREAKARRRARRQRFRNHPNPQTKSPEMITARPRSSPTRRWAPAGIGRAMRRTSNAMSIPTTTPAATLTSKSLPIPARGSLVSCGVEAGGKGGGDGLGATGAPHAWQNRADAKLSAPQDLQNNVISLKGSSPSFSRDTRGSWSCAVCFAEKQNARGGSVHAVGREITWDRSDCRALAVAS